MGYLTSADNISAKHIITVGDTENLNKILDNDSGISN